uniref:Cytochrome c oxidase subunit 4 isoform 1, mitochondrial n=1 Tax=Oryctolagus cuniculus TaxID=9986 RepID=A0A5F9D2Q2_RABIT
QQNTGQQGITGKEEISISACVRAHRGASINQCDYLLPSLAHVKHLSAIQKALKEKEKASRNSFTKDEKVKLYHIHLNDSFAEINKDMDKWKMVVGMGILPGRHSGLLCIMVLYEKNKWKKSLLLTDLRLRGKAAEDGPSIWPATHVGDPEEAPGSWFWPSPALAIEAISELNKQMEDWCLSVSLSLSPSPSPSLSVTLSNK